jgi:hypothetical protein
VSTVTIAPAGPCADILADALPYWIGCVSSSQC